MNGDGYADIVIASGNTNERVYVSLGGPEGPSAPTIFSPGFPYQAVAGVDDVNGDGFADVVIAPFTYPSNAGTADLYLGSAGGLSKTPIVLIGPGVGPGGPYRTDSFAAISGAGDMNGDGYADFVIGGMGVNSAYVYFGGPNGPGSNPVTLVGPGDIHGQFGIAVSGAGDVNGDGLSDLAVGAIFAGNPGTAGAAYVVLGAPQGLVPTPISLVDKSASAAPEAGVGYDLFGDAVAGGGDVDQDGYDDVIVGAYDVNRTFLFFGSAAGPSMSPVTLAGPQGRFGRSVAE